MSFSIFKNPFEKAKQRKKDDAELVGELLGPEEEAEMRKAMGAGSDSDRERDDSIRLTKEEEATKKKVEEEVSLEQRWKEYVDWAMEFGRSDEWVGRTFIFNDDGSVEVEGNLDLRGSGVTRFPKGLIRIPGRLDLGGCEGLTSLEYLPSSIGGNLDLGRCTGLTNLKHLPSNVGGEINLSDCTGLTSLENISLNIGSDLDLTSCTRLKNIKDLSSSKIGGFLTLSGCELIKDIPEGIKIGAGIIVEEYQQELITDAKSKGYIVHV